MSEVPFRILSLDGGGIRGLFTASFLTHIEEETNTRLIDHFDLLVGTSTGSIIALGLAAGVPAREILSFYQRDGPKIFADGPKWRWAFRPKYSNDTLASAIRTILGDKTLGELLAPVCVPSHELVDGHPRVFKDDHHHTLHWGGHQPVWKVAMASAAAPTYFPSFQIEGHDAHIDGGVWANNPIVVGITEAVKYFEQPLDNIAALSVGTGSLVPRLTHSQAKRRGLVQWGLNARLLSVVMDAQAQSAHYTACHLLADHHYLRVDAELNQPISLDSYSDAAPLIERGKQAGRKYKNQVAADFLAWPSRGVSGAA